ncbi:hypothetical protein [Actinoplanes teichomyceticus]|uniref:Peptidase inhibitor family I36 n=1 Tax=Actinoplanes teichomyceticus TaxID=1867 RepID=A0A561VMR2_ACTTI|nr:hypothetical protein [Actinoplanes teichomyceticus]TWG12883.1 hypothetical protein FHX34_105751 [Actinoplanes teichomyceticus]GIF13633.1 hypothetical protein Ate01nite_36650 [Actinoplanes teichomyceticus]
MHIIRRTAGTLTVAAVAAAGALLPGATAAHAAAAYQGCPSGYVCIYPNAGWNNGQPSLKFYTYGAHNLSGQFGVKRFFNNQTGGAIARNCTGYNGTGCQGIQPAGTYGDYNYTPYNSVVLAP